MAQDITALLHDLRDGDENVVDQLMPVVYDELRGIARRQLRRERPDHTLSTTALVHEAYVRLVDQTLVAWQDRAHFFAVAARAMRRVLVDHARKRTALKRGGKQQPIPLDRLSGLGAKAQVSIDAQADLLLSLDEALDRLAVFSDRLARIVELRFFGGMTEEETAEALGVSARTVRRDWVKAKAWLFKELYPDRL
jgi:RNA polymerase sigma factor (TIGR02999 family)